MLKAVLAGLVGLALLAGPAAAQDGGGLPAFASTTEMTAWLAAQSTQDPPPDTSCSPEWEVCPGYDDSDGVVGEAVVTASRIQAAPITNVQEAGVDEGDIVKMWGDILIILRRGRLFTVDTARGDLRPVDWIDAFPPGADPDDYDWFDEMLVVDGWVVVIGYSYAGDGSDIIRFRLDRRGNLTYADSHRLSSDDYFSARNYASRLIENRLIVYSPQYVGRRDPMAHLPTLSRLEAGEAVWTRTIVRPPDVHHDPLNDTSDPDSLAIHTVTQCDLTARVLNCEATALLGPEGRTFYVSSTAVYLWLSRYRPDAGSDDLADSLLYRIPLDVGAPQALAVRGEPVDQFSFEEDPVTRRLHILVISQGGDDAMWRLEFAADAAALLSFPLARFGEGRDSVQDTDYRLFPPAPDNAYRLHNRFVGRHLLYTASTPSWSGDPTTILSIVPLDGGEAERLMLSGGTERIEVMGRDALLVTRSEDVTLRSIALEPDAPARSGFSPYISDVYVLADSRGAESRSHAFFYQPDPSSPDGEFGVLGLPVIREFDDTDLEFDHAADMVFLNRGNNRLRLAGLLESRPDLQRDDGCVVSCIDWYGDARPIFVGGRIFALLGFELVEGQLDGRDIRELRRVNFATVLPDH
jgi:hypothetical protein